MLCHDCSFIKSTIVVALFCLWLFFPFLLLLLAPAAIVLADIAIVLAAVVV